MKIFTKILRYFKRKIAHGIFFFVRDNFDEFIGNSATLQNIQDLQRLISEAVNADRFKINDNKTKIGLLSQEMSDNKTKIGLLSQEMSDNKTKIGLFSQESGSLTEFIGFSPAKLKMKRKLDDVPGIDYVKFENKYRGEEALIKSRQSEFLPFFKNCTNVLDIGCGRGEFLELMKEQGTYATGIDIDSGMVGVCKKKGLNVIKADVLEFLDEMKENEVDGVFCSQVMEHFPVREIQWILYTLSKKLRNGGIALFETINPRCLSALRNFYLDNTHIQPLDVESFLFMAESYQFRHNTVILSSPVDLGLNSTTQDLKYIDQYRDWALIINKV